MRKIAIILAGGRGTRMQSDIPKQFMLLKDKPVINYSIDAFEDSLVIDGFIIAAPSSDVDYISQNILTRRNCRKFLGFSESGDTRYATIKNALDYLCENGYEDDTCVFIHDSARPYITQDLLIKLFGTFGKYGNAIPCVKVKDTIKEVRDGVITESPDRELLWVAQTPQVFSLAKIRDAYNKMYEQGDFNAITDDAEVAKRFGGIKCHVVEGNYQNIKITTKEDINRNTI